MIYLEMFETIRDLYKDTIEESEFYDGYFADFYDTYLADEIESNFYLTEAFNCGRKVLELCCGNGRITMLMAQNGFMITGYDISKCMLRKLENRKLNYPKSVQKRVNYKNLDIFKVDFEHNYDVILIPATTISILCDDEDKIVNLLKNLNHVLNKNGSLIFDYRVLNGSKTKSELSVITEKSESQNSFTLVQEFNNYIQGRSISNFYTQIITKDRKIKQYLSYTNKQILSDDFIMKILDKSGFFIYRIEQVIISDSLCKFVVAKRNLKE